MPDRILIWGAGAIGGTVGTFLKQAGNEITFVDIEPEHVAATRDPAQGLRITGPIVTAQATAPAFTPGELDGVWDHIFLCVKAQHTEQAAQALLPHLSPSGYVVSLQNGLCEEIVAKVVGQERVIGAFINFGADWIGSGEVQFGNYGAFVLGELDGRITERLQDLHATIQSGFEPNAGKLGYAALLFAQALGQLGIADCLARPELLPLWRALGGEVSVVAAGIGVGQRGFNGFDPAAFAPGATEAQARQSVDAMVAFNRPNAKTHSGIWRDLAIRKRRTEVDGQVLPVVQTGQRKGLIAPNAAS